MVLGGDVGLEDACNLALCALVGRFSYKALGGQGYRTGWRKYGTHYLGILGDDSH
jgi:hypothetical protein